MKNRKKNFVILIIIVILVICIYIWLSTSAKKRLEALEYESISMDLVTDGTYYAEVDAILVFVNIGVTVQNHTITDINIIEHRNGLGKKAEDIIHTMIAENTYAVDAISGATLSSECIKSAVSKALKLGY